VKLSVAIVCKNNASTIGRTLESVRDLADEIVAVDSGSTDATIELLERAGARIVRSAWLGHVKTKQLALDECRGEWVLSLDSDESPEPELKAAIRRVVGGGAGGPAGYEVNRRVYYRGTPLRFAWQPEWRLRLVRRGAAAWAGLDPHDQLRLGQGAAGRLEGVLRHDSIETWAEFMGKQAQHARTMASSLHAAGVRPSYSRLVISPVGAFLKQLVLKSAWRDGWLGWVAAGSTAASALMKHMMLFELSRREGEPQVDREPNRD
jgi:glycosyltransferase involved in cell wall biosynthesis